jgi:hypothetical protein
MRHPVVELCQWLTVKPRVAGAQIPMAYDGGGKLIGGVGIDIPSKRKQSGRYATSCAVPELFSTTLRWHSHELDDDNPHHACKQNRAWRCWVTPRRKWWHPVWDFIVEDPASDAIPCNSPANCGSKPLKRTFRRKDAARTRADAPKLINNANGETRGMRSTLQDISALNESSRNCGRLRKNTGQSSRNCD